MACTKAAMTIAWVFIVLVSIFVLIMVGEASPKPATAPTTSNLRPPKADNTKAEDSSNVPQNDSEAPKLLWKDEFDGDELNQDYWSYDSVKTVFEQQEEQALDDDDFIQNVPLDPVGTDLEYYDPHAISIKDGLLTIATRQVINAVVPLVSGRIKTQDKIVFQYGTVEARIRIRSSCKQGVDVCVSARNLSPSFWTRGSGSTSYGEPTMGQVDIFAVALPGLRRGRRVLSKESDTNSIPSLPVQDETLRLNSNGNHILEYFGPDAGVAMEASDLPPWTGYSGASWIAPPSATNGGHVLKKSYHDDFPIENWMDQDFHNYKFDWTPTRMATYIDDELVWEMDITDGSCKDCQDLHLPQYLLLAISVLEAPSWASSSTSATMDLSVDYVRLFDNGFANVTISPLTRRQLLVLDERY